MAKNLKRILAYTKCTNDVQTIYNRGGITVLLDTLYQSSEKNLNVVQFALIVIGNCLKYKRDLPQAYTKADLVWEELCEFLVKTLKAAEDSNYISTHCLRILDKLAREECMREYIYKLVDGFQLLLQRLTLDTLRYEENVYILDIMVKLLHQKNSSVTFVSQNGLLRLTKLMRSTDEVDLFRRCADIVLSLAKRRDRQCYFQRLKDDGCFKTLVTVGMDKKKSSNIRKKTVNLLFNLCEIKPYSRFLVLADIHTLLIRLIETAPMGHTKSCAVRSLSLLCCDVANRSTLNKCGAIEMLISLLKDNNVKKLHHVIVDGLHWFLYDQEALQVMVKEYDLVSALSGHLNRLIDGLANCVRHTNSTDDNYCYDNTIGVEREQSQSCVNPVLSSSPLINSMDNCEWNGSLSPVSLMSISCSSESSSIYLNDSKINENNSISDMKNSDRLCIATILNLLKAISRLAHSYHINVVKFCMKGLLGCIVKDSENRADAYKVMSLIMENKCCLKVMLRRCVPWLIYQYLMNDHETNVSSGNFTYFATHYLHDESLKEHWNTLTNDEEVTTSATDQLSSLKDSVNLTSSFITAVTDTLQADDYIATTSSSPKEMAVSLLQLIGKISSSDYGKGEIKNILSTGNTSWKRACAFSLPYLLSYERSMYKVLLRNNGISTILEPLLLENVDDFTTTITCHCISSLVERFQSCKQVYRRKRARSNDGTQHFTKKVQKLEMSQDSSQSYFFIDDSRYTYYQQQSFMTADAILVTENGSELPVNREIISQQSVYFSAMYSGYFIEAKLEKSYIKEIDDTAMIAILLYLYGFNWRIQPSIMQLKTILSANSINEVKFTVKLFDRLDEEDNIEFYWNVLISADKLLLEELKEACEPYIIDLLKPHNRSETLFLSCVYSCEGVFMYCIDQFFRYWTSAEQCNCFKQFPEPYKEDFIKRVCNFVNKIFFCCVDNI
ncbi:uncharacterized protein TRIADDRAFT_59264 [Trichoplax adhaerens]|uniref:BTB domain-containing protein n=1 Tax=Trichoplax adhaerens TaxID=10228 RepID=B3S5B2_TRIAD|nr:predicted protein [Trichoplax adhaerens]EDV22107.1 predicted protein [Trichoplax adhaerens]|eukprot:XP_002115262.1 predicted protein [Trichoplax adhaerens]